ncbi:MAG: hypothetical protein ICV87_11285 [Gemmatimonadetes bacterium]|nr:hypothetical protein [Gemmatimonadota bacterium]
MPPDSPADAQQRTAYVPPALEPLGTWSALTLQQSVPVTSDRFVDYTLKAL